jgi:pyruvate-formate lyase-activating enzyme
MMAESISLSVLGAGPAPAAPQGDDGSMVELTRIHHFATKLRQPEVMDRLRAYVEWQAVRRNGLVGEGDAGSVSLVPDYAPVSINLDLTTACNYACDHCIDMDILNTGIMFDHAKLLSSLAQMAGKGLKSVIVIGGGEPTLYPKFSETIRFMKSLGLQVSIVSNGAGNRRIAEIADCMDHNDWVRLSLDSGTDRTFQLMHKPKKAITLDRICELVPEIKARNPRLTVGFSYIVTWRGAETNDSTIVENLGEIALAARLARDHQFSYIAFKPFLTRAEGNNAEVIGIEKKEDALAGVVTRIRQQVEEAKKLATKDFRVIETTGLKALYHTGSLREYARQPRECHMQFFRQVLSPLGTYNCPVYRNQPHGQLGDKNAYADAESFAATRRRTAESIGAFDASTTCAEVTCLYNDVNWWIEDLIENPEKMKALSAVCDDEPDFFL